MTIGYMHGRFQPPHKGHLHIWKQIIKECDEIWIGIVNPLREQVDNKSLSDEILKSVKKARDPKNNPFSFSERYQMIYDTLLAEGVPPEKIRITPAFSYYDHKNWKDFMPPTKNSIIYMPIKDPHHTSKVIMYEKNGWKVKKVKLKSGFSGTEVRKLIPKGNWKQLVPVGTQKFLEERFS
jgi:cytidyltransferase-like protein